MEMIEQAPPSAHSPAPTTESDPDEGSSSEKPKIKRPQNAFMLFRGDWHRAFKAAPQNQDVVLKQAELSRLASRAWAAVDDETRERYQQRAAEEKLAHRRKYPEYKYQPGPQKYSKGVRIAPYAPRKKRQPKKEPKWYEREEIYVGPQGAWTSNEVRWNQLPVDRQILMIGFFRWLCAPSVACMGSRGRRRTRRQQQGSRTRYV